jgi:hypothetical protein
MTRIPKTNEIRLKVAVKYKRGLARAVPPFEIPSIVVIGV